MKRIRGYIDTRCDPLRVYFLFRAGGVFTRKTKTEVNEYPMVYYSFLGGPFFTCRFKDDLLIRQASIGNVSAVSELLSGGANPRARNRRALRKAILHNKDQVVHAIIREYPEVYYNGLGMCLNLNLRLFWQLIRAHKPETLDLHYAAFAGSGDIVRMSRFFERFALALLHVIIKGVLIYDLYFRDPAHRIDLRLDRIPLEILVLPSDLFKDFQWGGLSALLGLSMLIVSWPFFGVLLGIMCLFIVLSRFID